MKRVRSAHEIGKVLRKFPGWTEVQESVYAVEPRPLRFEVQLIAKYGNLGMIDFPTRNIALQTGAGIT
jgi:hypothetical protein